MRCDFAPLEGITDSAFRRIHHKYFSGVDRYFMPFVSPTQHRTLTAREQRELPLADSVDFIAVPQLLGKNAEDMLWAIEVCRDRGYQTVNINLGCPSGTVVSKGKGSGMLAEPWALESFLEKIYAGAALPVSLKTRIGMTDPEEWPDLLDIFCQYPVDELIIHPRVRKSFYAGPCDLEAFALALEKCPFPVCYNGNLNSKADIASIQGRFPTLSAVMIGRGLIANPAMLSETPTTRDQLQQFLAELLETYTESFGSRRNAIFRMKENWHYLISMFDESEKAWK